MNTRRSVGSLLLACTAFGAFVSAARAEGDAPVRKPDLGDLVQGSYFGNVTSDSKGSSKSDVAVKISRTGKNRVQIESDYDRLPTVTVRLTRATGKILNVEGTTTFFYDPAKSPPHLDLTFNNEVSWSGDRR